MYQLSILIPSAYPEKLARLIQNLKETMFDFYGTEIVICLDGDKETERIGNFVYCYSPPSKYRSTFHEKPVLEATGRFMMMANDDIEFKTMHWDRLIPYHDFPDDYVLFHFKDDTFNNIFACHPVFSRKTFELNPGILTPLYQITKCDNTIWDIHPAQRRIYIPDIEIIHHHEEYGKEWKQAYKDDEIEYANNQRERDETRRKLCKAIGMNDKVLIGVITGEMARRAEFYTHYNAIQRPPESKAIFVHGPSIAFNRNQVIRAAIEHDCTHVMFIDDDVFARQDIVFQLLKHDKDVVTALQLSRSFPHRPYLYDLIMPNGRFQSYTLNDSDKGLIEVKACGFGAVLIRTEIFKRLEEPWIRYHPGYPDQLGEDIYFFHQLAKLGIKTYCDLDCVVGHAASCVIWPTRNEYGWYVTYNTNGEGMISFPHSIQEHLMEGVAR